MDSRDLSTGQIAGQHYLQTHSVEERRAAGRVYTPPHIVQFILEQAGYASPHGNLETPFLDPACGAGAFLEQVVAILAQRLQRKGSDIRARSGFQNFLAHVEHQIWGIDSDERSCEIAREVVAGTVEYLTGRRPTKGFFDRNVVTADFLFDPTVERLEPIREGTLGFLVGNPPYVTTTRLQNQYKERLRASFRSATGRLELYTVFVERALTLLPTGGRLALITPDKFLTSYSAKFLRALVLQKSAVRSIATFHSHKVFDNAATTPCVTVLEKGAAKRPVTVRRCVSRPDQARVQVLESRRIDHFLPGTGEWGLACRDTKKLVSKLQAHHPTLRELSHRISAGPATGRDGIFVFCDRGRPDIEPELMRPAIRGRDIDSYELRDPKLSVLLPYAFDASGTPHLIRLSDFPGAARYLNKHRDALSARHCVRVWGKAWYEFHDQPSADLAGQPKILVPDVANSNRFAVDNGKYFALHSAYYVLAKQGIDLEYLVAVLNSSVAAFLIRINSPVVKDGFQRFRQQFLMCLPIPVTDAREMRVITKAVSDGDHDRADDLIHKVFGLNERETAEIRSYACKSRA